MADPTLQAADLDDEPLAPVAKSAEDRKAASDLARLDAQLGEDDEAASAPTSRIDHEAVSSAMKAGAGALVTAGSTASTKAIKVDQTDVALLVDELELSKVKATELLRAHDGDAVRAMRAFVSAGLGN